MPGKLLLVEDDRFILNPLEKLLGLQGYHCTVVGTAEEAWRALESEAFDLMLLDIGLPDQDGISLCRRIRTRHRLPIIMLTARDATRDKMIGLEVGADDYITKPFDPQEVVARVRAQLRRRQEYDVEAATRNQIVLGRLVVDVDAHDALIDGQPAHLTAREFDLLYLLARHSARVLSRDWLFEQVWGYDAEFGIKILAVTVRRLRSKIEEDPSHPQFLLTVRGYGYKLVPDVHDEKD